MVTTRSGLKTKLQHLNNLKTPPQPKKPQVIVNKVIEDLYVEALDRAELAEQKLAEVENKCNMLEYEMMVVRNEHVYELIQVEKASKNRQFYFVTWLSCSFLLQALYVYFAFRGFSFH